MADLGFLGMRVTGSWPENVQPENYRQMLMLFNPNGMAPLLAVQSFLKQEKTDDPTIHWYTKTLATQRATGTAGSFVYTDSLLSSAYTSGGVAGTVVFVKTSLAQCKHFRAGHTVMLRLSTDYRYDCRGIVNDVSHNGASSYVSVTLREADPISGGLALVDTILVIGNSNAEAGSAPSAISYDPAPFDNKCQIFWTTLEISRRMLNTKLRAFDAYQELRREAMQYHGLEMERSLIHGKKFDGTGTNGKPQTEMDGYRSFITTNAAANVKDFMNTTDTAYAGKTWLQAGAEFLDEMVYVASDFGKAGTNVERLGLCGRDALRGVNRLARHLGWKVLDQMTTKFGMKVTRWETPLLDVYLKTTASFSFEPTDLNTVMLIDPKLFVGRVLTDTRFLPDKTYDSGGFTAIDGKKEGWLTDMSFEIHNPLAGSIMYNVGKDNTAA